MPIPTVRTYTIPATEGLPARRYRAETWVIGGKPSIEVSVHDDGFEPTIIADGSVADVRAALGFETRMTRQRIPHALRALIPSEHLSSLR